MNDYKNFKVPELREIARSLKLKKWYRLRKAELISLIVSEEQRQEEERRNDPALQAKQRREKRLEEVTAIAKAKAEKKAISKARRQQKREEAKREAERRAEVKRVEANQRKQREENITGQRPDSKETKSQRKRRQRLEKQAEQAETQRVNHERAQRKKNPKKARKEEKRRHRATKKEKRRKEKREQERLRRQTQPELLSTALEENVQRWFISGAGYKIPDAFLNDKENDVREIVDKVIGPKKVYAVLKCELVKHNLKTGEKMYTEFHGRSKTHTITIPLGDTYEEMKGKMLEKLSEISKRRKWLAITLYHGVKYSYC